MAARLLARATVSDDDSRHDHPGDPNAPLSAFDAEDALSDLYATAVRESAGRLGCVWVVGRGKSPPPRDAETIPIDIDLTSISGPRPIVTSRHRRESRSRVALAAMPTPPARSLLAEVAKKKSPAAKTGFLQLMAVTACSTFLVIVIALFVAEYRGMPVHGMIENAGHVIAQAIRNWLASL